MLSFKRLCFSPVNTVRCAAFDFYGNFDNKKLKDENGEEIYEPVCVLILFIKGQLK
jgi:hypothetical protein